MVGRNEASFLPLVLQSLKAQTLQPREIIFVDDASVDDSAEIAESYGANVIRLTEQHPSYTGRPEFAKIWNHALRHIDCSRYDYMVQCGADIVLPLHYIETLVDRMERAPRLVFASGVIYGEPTYRTHARGAGRLIQTWFWHRFVREYPIAYCWESYPLYKALSLGYQVESFPDLEMHTLRKTKEYKSTYGYAMRELGYLPYYALARCMLAMAKNMKIGVRMLHSYLTSPFKPFDKEIAKYIKNYQTNMVGNLIKKPKTLVKRLSHVSF